MKWEYLSLETIQGAWYVNGQVRKELGACGVSSPAREMNILGREGWEFVWAFDCGPITRYLFKRPSQ
jgi:hypothetical protein